jgi:hypothetical protein
MVKNPLDDLTLPPGARPDPPAMEPPICPKCRVRYEVGDLLVYCIVRLSETDLDVVLVHAQCPEVQD